MMRSIHWLLTLLLLLAGCNLATGSMTISTVGAGDDDDSAAGDDDDSVGDDDDSVGDDDDDDDDDDAWSPTGDYAGDMTLFIIGGRGGDEPACEAEIDLEVDDGALRGETDCEIFGFLSVAISLEGTVDDEGAVAGTVVQSTDYTEDEFELEGEITEGGEMTLGWQGVVQMGPGDRDVIGEVYAELD